MCAYIKSKERFVYSNKTSSFIRCNMANNTRRGIKASESNDPIDSYIVEHSLRLTPVQKELIEYTNSLPGKFLRNLDSDS